MDEDLSLRRVALKQIIILLLFVLSMLLAILPASMVDAQEGKELLNLAIYEPLQEHIYNYSQKNSIDIFKLAYKSIFQIDEQERLQTELLEDAIWSPDHLSLELTLRQGLEFSSGKNIDAEDVAYSILYYRYYQNVRKLRANFDDEEFAKLDWPAYLAQNLANPESFLEYTEEEPLEDAEIVLGQAGIPDNPLAEELADTEANIAEDGVVAGKIYRTEITTESNVLEALDLIEKIEIIARDKLVLRLSEQAIRLPWYLTFPILPKEYAAGRAEGFAPSSGTYTIKVKGEDLLLTKFADKSGRNLLVRSFSDFKSALEAFNNGEIDLLFCPAEEFSNLSLRKDLRSVAWDGAKFNVLLCNKAYSPFAAPEYSILLREALKQSSKSNVLPAEPCLPYRSNDWRADYKDEKIVLNPTAKEDLSKLFAEDSIHLAGQSTSHTRSSLNQLKSVFFDLDLEVVTDLLKFSLKDSISGESAESLDSVAGLEQVDLDEVDFFLLGLDLSLPTDVTQLINEINKQLAGYFALPKLGSQEHILDPLYPYAWNNSAQDAEVLAMRSLNIVLQEYILAQGIYPLGFEQEGFILGSRVENSFRAYYGNPYKNIEVLDLCP